MLIVFESDRYCEAIAATLKLPTKPVSFYHPALTEQVRALSGRLSAAPVPSDKGISWIARKMPRPTLDNVWQSLEGRVHKFVAGDEDEGKPDGGSLGNGNGGGSGTILNVPNATALGPFSHYSSISPGSSSGSLSRAQSSSDLRFATQQPMPVGGPFAHGALLQRPASGGGFSSTPMPVERDARQRSTSAMVPGANASSWHSYSDSGFNASTQPFSKNGSSDPQSDQASSSATVVTASGGGGGGGWWDAASGGGTPLMSSPAATFTTFEGASTTDDASGFIDPMASFGMPSFSTAASSADFTTYRNHDTSKDDEDDDDDLGLGNKSSRKKEKAGDDDDDDEEDGKKSGAGADSSAKSTSANLKADDKSEFH